MSGEVAARCLACGQGGLTPLADLGETPLLTGALWEDAAEARLAGRGRIELASCPGCAHVQNVAFEPALVDYDTAYDNSLHFSATFHAYAQDLAQQLVCDYDLAGGSVVEIGSGQGDFLRLLCDAGMREAVGYDPTFDGDGGDPRVTLHPEYFVVGEQPPSFDLLVCRHVLEHLERPSDLLAGVARAARHSGGVVYLEVPAAEFNFGPEGLWDCIYPHVSYFSAASLVRLLDRAGLYPLHVTRGFDGQFHQVVARAQRPGDGGVTPDPAGTARHRATLDSFDSLLTSTVGKWRATLGDGAGTVLWGAGSKGVTFLNAVDPERGIAAVVDVNPRKWGAYLPVTGHQVVAPTNLGALDVSRVLVTNPVYEQEIARTLTDLGISAEVQTV